MLSRTILTHLEVKQETEVHFLVGTVILQFLSIFKKSQASSPLKHWIPCAFRGVKVMWFPLSRWGGVLWFSLESPQGIQISLHLVTWYTSLNLSHCREIRPYFESGILRYIPLETESTESLSPTYCWVKSQLEVLMENWLTSSVKDRDQLSFWDDMWCMELTSSCCAEMNIHIALRRVFQRISVVSSRKSSHLYCILWNTG